MKKTPVAIVLVLIGTVLLAGCLQESQQPSPSPTQAPTAQPTATASPTAIPTQSPTAAPLPPGFSIETTGECGIPQNRSAAITFNEKKEFTMSLDFITGNICDEYAIESVLELESYPVQMAINLKKVEKPGQACVGCEGVATATIRGKLTTPTANIKVFLGGKQVALFDTHKLFEAPEQITAAAQKCVNEFLTSPVFELYNENSKTYWFKLEDTTGKYPLCSPACVVFENLSTEINYRCTGLVAE